MLPTTDETLSSADILSLADEELDSFILPLLMSQREEYLVASKDITIVSGTSNYLIPSRAIGGKLRDVLLDSGSGFIQVPRTEPERESDYSVSGSPLAYKLEGNYIVLLPAPATGGTLRVRYFRRPSKLVATSACATLSAAFAAGSTALTTSADVPATFTNGVLVDTVTAESGFESNNDDRTLSSPATTSAPIASPGLLKATAAGDYLCLAGESPIPQVPVELHGLLAQRTAYKALEALGSASADKAKASSQEMYARVMTLLAPRVEGAARVVVNRFGPGFGNRLGGWRRRGF